MSYLINLTKRKLPLHKHKHYEILIYTKGDGLFHCEEKDIPVCPGKIVIVPPETMHSAPLGNDLERISISGDFHQFFSLTSPTLILDNSESEGMSLAKTIYTNRYPNTEYLSALCNAFAYFLLQRLKIDNEMHLIIKDMMNKITANFYDCDISINDLLKKSGYAEDYIRAQFKKTTGKTPTEFLTKIRISHACYLIDVYRNSLSLAEIAEKCGYTDYAYFSRKFKQIMGVSPKKYMTM